MIVWQVLGLLVAAVVWLLVAAGFVTWLWNLTLPELFGTKHIEYWQAFRLVLLGNLLFGAPATFVFS